MSGALSIELACSGCGTRIPSREDRPFRCPAARAGEDHVLGRDFHAESLRDETDWFALFRDGDANPFLRYRPLLYAYRVARLRGMRDEEFVDLVNGIDDRVAAVAGCRFRETPLAPAPGLSRELGLTESSLWIKDETGNVSGSHKSRHLLGILLWLEIVRRTAVEPPTEAPLAIASCGNAALAAAIVARAAERPLSVFIPPGADPHVVDELMTHHARIVRCPRARGETGDPCFHRFRRELANGALPFTVQGSENALALEGGLALGYEIAGTLLRESRTLDTLVIQVGGGALASSLTQGLREAAALGVIPRMPRIHLVQTRGAFPLARAYDRVVDRVLESDPSDPETLTAADRVRRVPQMLPDQADGVLREAARHRSEFMWPWETEPRSVATGILDDETYDWIACLRAMLETGGFPVVVTEEELHEAHSLGQGTGIPVCPTGSAGLAGVLHLRRAGVLGETENVGVVFTGRDRNGRVTTPPEPD